MLKRTRTDDESSPPSKRLRSNTEDRFSSLSDELILRTLSFLPAGSLILCHRLSQRFHVLAGDPQLWKSAYYNRFVRPRASRIPGIREQNVPAASLYYSSKTSRWLDDDHLVQRGKDMNWKRQYKLRHNWSRGSCEVAEIQIAERPSVPEALVRLHEDTVITADGTYGLRAWSTKGGQSLLATISFASGEAGCASPEVPTSLAVDFVKRNMDEFDISVGFTDGKFGVYSLNKQAQEWSCRYMHAASTNGMVSAIAYASPYLLTMTEAQLLSLYRFPDEPSANQSHNPPRLLSSLKSHTAWPPLSFSIRASSSSIVASIAYALPTYLAGWSVGLQELRLTPEGSIIQSRLTSASNQGFTPLFLTPSGTSSPIPGPSVSPIRAAENPTISLTRPTSLSYSHPYLLASHPDNTLTLYLVTSSERELFIAEGRRLWGHTSSVSGAHVGDRGKAVSVSTHGDEIRVWELEGGMASNSSRRRAAAGELSVQVRTERVKMEDNSLGEDSRTTVNRGLGLLRGREHDLDEASITKGWVGFDEEKVIVHRERCQGSQALVVYDFS